MRLLTNASWSGLPILSRTSAARVRGLGLGLGLGLGRQRGDQKLALTPTQYRRPMASYAYDAVVEPVTLPGTPDTISGGLVFIALSMPR